MPAVSPDDVLAMLRDAVAIVLEVDGATVSRETRLVEDLHADSLAIVEIVEVLEERLAAVAPPGFRIDDEALDVIATVGDAVDYTVARL